MNGHEILRISFDMIFKAQSPDKGSRRPLDRWTPRPGWR